MEKEENFKFKKDEKINLNSYVIPQHFEEVLSEFIAKLIQSHPDNACLFAINYFSEKLKECN
ncbi:conserved Plasmodium protein, unknown function [Plasmodium malariae]|uniref:RIIa domain-containing protein n=2 Tax=Plasmodium (Plasmodium) TaxID=418103 RepID=A0A1D3PBY7_PLAMA|nr:conserved Plasmodium protein, unknown function [Plasmodium malariae]SCN12568.1 conserved Plasmodium protein, unknown function [Plasmodium malariae]